MPFAFTPPPSPPSPPRHFETQPVNPINPTIGYQPELWTVEKDVIYFVINALVKAQEDIFASIEDYASIDKGTLRDKMWIQKLTNDLNSVESALEKLRKAKVS